MLHLWGLGATLMATMDQDMDLELNELDVLYPEELAEDYAHRRPSVVRGARKSDEDSGPPWL